MARVVFLGTPDFAVPSLKALVMHPELEVVGVVTQPDRPAGRGRGIRKSPVKRTAEELGLPVFQPETLRDPEAVEHLRRWSPDVLVVVAFGQILRRPVLELAPFGSLNVHASLLPRWRGAAPIQYAIRAGDEETGITIMKMDEGLDTGPILVQRAIPIAPDETGASLHDRLAALGAEMLPQAVCEYLAGELVPHPQPEEGVTLAPTLKKSDGEIDWSHPAIEIDRQVRAYDPWPGTFTYLQGRLLKVIRGTPLPEITRPEPPGTLLADEGGLAVQTGEGLYRLDVIQPAGKKQMTGRAFLAGHPQAPGLRLGR
ncbi:MAG TPA: methionyl-tRNA formyltransferase [Chloroflexi bacterium]|nr:methionyl-tRNA formyltransferase [Chloroflexota bacterium]